MTDKTIADGIWWTDTSGTRRWMTGDMLMERIRNGENVKFRGGKIALTEFAEALGQRFGQMTRKHDSEIAELRAEIAELRAAMPLRSVGGGKAA